MGDKAILQEYADAVVAPEYRQPLKTLEDACKAVGWAYVDSPECCGQKVEVHSFIGPYFACCKACGRFIRDMRAPVFEGSCATVLDSDKVDLDTEIAWISGQRQPA